MTVPALRTLALAAALAATLAACESPSKITQATPSVETRSPMTATGNAGATAGNAGVTTNATPAQSTVASVDLATPRSVPAPGAGAAGSTALMSAPTQRIVYFDFDSFVIKDEFKTLLDAHAKVLVRDGNKRMVIEGHTDERGGREYNLALGQKRAEAVLRSLALLGVNDKQLEAVSFGEERPAVQGSDESAWARNRRAELKDR
jgi:peptidoglycan-associated lipoprotein